MGLGWHTATKVRCYPSSAPDATAWDDPDKEKEAWVKWNKRHKEKAVRWSQSDPEKHLIAMRTCMQPFVRFLKKLCELSGKQFEKKQMLANAKRETSNI